MSSSVADLSADVKGMVEQLKNIGRGVESGNKATESLGACLQLTSALVQIESARTKAHELLEAQTIAASVLRHKLATFPHTLQTELEDVLQSAKCSVAAQRVYLQTRLSDLKAANTQLDKREDVLELQNDDLMPQYKSALAKYKAQIQEVNELMTERTKVKIVLNETEDKLQSIKTKTEGFEVDMVNVQQTTKQNWEEFQLQIQSLNDTQEEARKMCFSKKEAKQQLSRVFGTLEDDAIRTVDLMKTNQQFLSGVMKEILQQVELQQQLQVTLRREANQTEKLTIISNDIQAVGVQMREHFKNEDNHLKKQKCKFLNGAEQIEAELKKLFVIQRTLRTDLRKERESKHMDKLSATSIQENVSTTERTLQFQSEEGARLQAENHDLEFQLKETKETHQVMLGLCGDQMQTLQSSLKKEKNARKQMEMEVRNMELQISLKENELTRTTSFLFSFLEARNLLYLAVSSKLSTLQSTIKSSKEVCMCFRGKLLMATTQLDSFIDDLQLQTQQLEKDNLIVQKYTMERVQALKELKPRCVMLQSQHKHRSTTYEAQKDTIVVMKNKRSGLKETAERLQRHLKNMLEPHEKLRLEVIIQRTYTREQLTNQTQHIQNMEQEVALTHQQLMAVVKENMRISEMMATFEKDRLWMRTLHKSAIYANKNFTDYRSLIHAILETRWSQDAQQETEYSGRDNHLLGEAVLLHEKTKERNKKTSQAYSHLEGQVETLYYFLHKVWNT